MTKLIVFDMDGVIFEYANVWLELHKVYGTYKKGLELTKEYLKTNYAKLVEEVVGKLWKGKSEAKFLELMNSIKYISGAKELFKWLNENDFTSAIISSGPKQLAERAQKELGIEYIFTNELIFKDGKVSGEFNWPIAADRKSVALRKLCAEKNIDFKDCIVVCHDDSDIKMAKTAGIAIGFCTDSEELRKYCKFIVEKKDLREIITFLNSFKKEPNSLNLCRV